MIKNKHLVPPIVSDLCESVTDLRRNQNERDNYYLRIIAIRDYCNAVLNIADKQTNTRKYVSNNK